MSDTLRLATRGSALALRQAESVREVLATRRRPVDLVEVETRGDRITDELIHRLGKTGAFVRALDEQVLAGDVDAAVHSMKDMPTEMPDDLVVAGVPERASANDVLVTVDGRSLDDLPSGATVGTSSLRRKAQLLAERPDLDVQPLRGNVDTRAEKLLAPSLQREHERRMDAEETDGADDDATAESFDEDLDAWFNGLSELQRRALERDVDTEYDAIVLAEAGLQRSGLAHSLHYQRLSPSRFVPAPGQGSLAITSRDDEVAERVHSAVDHPPTRVRATVERTILAELGGGCVAPVGIYAKLQGAKVNVSVRVLSQDGTEEIRENRDLPVERHPQAAREFAQSLRERGAADLIERARRETQPDRGAREDEADEPSEDGTADASEPPEPPADGAGGDADEFSEPPADGAAADPTADEATVPDDDPTADDADDAAAEESAPADRSSADTDATTGSFPTPGDSTPEESRSADESPEPSEEDPAADDVDDEEGATTDDESPDEDADEDSAADDDGDGEESTADHTPSTPWPTAGGDGGEE